MPIRVIYVDDADFPLVKKSAELLQQDIESVTGKKPLIVHQFDKQLKNLIVVGSLTQSSLLKELQAKKLLTAQKITGKWEAYQIESVDASKNADASW